MRLINTQNQSRFMIETCLAETAQPEQGRGRCSWKAFLIALMRVMSVLTV
jgi:hypothetical protein